MIKQTANALKEIIVPTVKPIERFMKLEAATGITLLLAMVFAMVWANSPLAHYYHDFVHFPIGFYFGNFKIQETLHFWVNDALMAIFFFMVSLEIKREMTIGELSTKKKAALPLIAAFGGMCIPAIIYFVLNREGLESRGWGIPTATDIAFSVGVLTVLGKRVPFALKAFLLALAVADDLGGIIVIAIFYAQKLQFSSLFLALIFLTISLMMRESGVKKIWAYIIVGIGAWLSLLASGIHATISGVVLGFMTPIFASLSPKMSARKLVDLSNDLERALLSDSHQISEQAKNHLREIQNISVDYESPLDRLSHKLQRWVNFFIVPLFAIVNTGIVFSSLSLKEIIANNVFLGVTAGLVLGKPIGIFVATWAAVKLGIGELPNNVNFKQILAVGFIAGIGFTVATFISHLALGQDPNIEIFAKMGILAASLVAAIAGSLLLILAK